MNTNDQDNQIEAPEADYLYRSKSQLPLAGYGLFTAIDIYKDETIAIFTGELLSDAEAKKRADSGNDQYFISMLDGSIMDSNLADSFAKYANDAKVSNSINFKNNAKITLDGNDKVCIQATKKIKAGDEIFVSYGKRYWQRHR